MSAPSEDIRDMLVDASAIGLVSGTNLFISEMPDTPNECVGIYDTGGDDPQANYTYERPTIQVRVRGEKGAYADTHALAVDIRDELHGAYNETVGSTRYVGIWQQGDILFVGYDDNHRPLVTINFRLQRTNA